MGRPRFVDDGGEFMLRRERCLCSLFIEVVVLDLIMSISFLYCVDVDNSWSDPTRFRPTISSLVSHASDPESAIWEHCRVTLYPWTVTLDLPPLHPVRLWAQLSSVAQCPVARSRVSKSSKARNLAVPKSGD